MMTRKYLMAVLTALAVVAIFAVDASAMYDAPLGRWMQRDPIGYVDGMNLYEHVGSTPEESDPLGLYGERIHRDLTTVLATMAGVRFTLAPKIGELNHGIDVLYSAREMGEKEYTLILEAAQLHGKIEQRKRWLKRASAERNGPEWLRIQEEIDDLWLRVREKETEAGQIAPRIVEWHFPGAGYGAAVEKGGRAARTKVEAAIKACNLKDFAEGLHPFQDSYSHWGVPTLGLVIPLSYGHNWKGLGPLGPAWSYDDADDPFLRPGLAQEMAKETYKLMVRFLKECECITLPDGRKVKRDDVTLGEQPEVYDVSKVQHFWWEK